MAINQAVNDVTSLPVIVIVEDESIVALDIKRFLCKNGYLVGGIFQTGSDLLDHLAKNACDLILMDIKIRGKMDGVVAAEKVIGLYNIPVILLTAFADDITIDRAKKVGPYGYIIKPFEGRELKTSIEMALMRHSLETQLYESEEKYRLLFEEDLSGDFLADSEGRLIDYNSSFSLMMEIHKISHTGQLVLRDFFPGADEYNSFFLRLKNNPVLKLQELSLKTAAGRIIVVLANIIAKVDENTGKIREIKGYLIDISDRKSLEDQLRQSQKMEAVGRLAGGVAHDFNNLLTVIIGYCSMIDADSSNPELLQSVEGILDTTKKASALTRQLLAFSRQQILNPKIVQVRDLLVNLEKMLHRLLPDNVTLYYSDLFHDSSIFIDPGQLEQVIINLVVNARDAIPESGLVTFSVENVKVRGNLTCSTGSAGPGEYVCISVKDTGSGMDATIISHIFDPFFTTKAQEKGTGLGLAMVYGIISQSGGVIDVESAPGKGSIFKIYLPRISGKKRAKDSGKAAADIPYYGNEKILLVEDDPKVRDIMMRAILARGYNLLTASNPGEAILIMEKMDSSSPLDLVVSDFLMPYMNGIELINRIRRAQPGVRYILISGYPEGTEKANMDIFSKDNILLKPFSPDDLLERMRRVLDT